MRPHVGLVLAILSATRLTPAQVCAPTTQPERQFRTAMKHRAPGPGRSTYVLIEAIIAWPPPSGIAAVDVRSADAPIDVHEQEALTFGGDLWRVVVEDNDCDLHLEVGRSGSGRDAPRVVAEIPAGPGYEAARAAILAAVHLPSARAGDAIDLETPVRVQLTGYGFWDGERWCRRDGVRGCGHGTAGVATLWELHPVWRVDILPAAQAAFARTEPPPGGEAYYARQCASAVGRRLAAGEPLSRECCLAVCEPMTSCIRRIGEGRDLRREEIVGPIVLHCRGLRVRCQEHCRQVCGPQECPALLPGPAPREAGGQARPAEATQEGPTPVPTRSPAAGRHLRCCDGSASPTCTIGRASYRGCCSHHGGVCEE